MPNLWRKLKNLIFIAWYGKELEQPRKPNPLDEDYAIIAARIKMESEARRRRIGRGS